MEHVKVSEPVVDWRADPYWRNRRLSPAQVQIHDIRLEGWRRHDAGTMLEMREVLASSLLPELEGRDNLMKTLPFADATSKRYDQVQLRSIANEFGWMNVLRSNEVQSTVSDPQPIRKCRWIHISSKFSDYLPGCRVGMLDWSKEPEQKMEALRQLEHCIHQQERFSKHGRYFAPFAQHLGDQVDAYEDDDRSAQDGPMLLSVPFLDWAAGGKRLL